MFINDDFNCFCKKNSEQDLKEKHYKTKVGMKLFFLKNEILALKREVKELKILLGLKFEQLNHYVEGQNE